MKDENINRKNAEKFKDGANRQFTIELYSIDIQALPYNIFGNCLSCHASIMVKGKIVHDKQKHDPNYSLLIIMVLHRPPRGKDSFLFSYESKQFFFRLFREIILCIYLSTL